MPMSTVAAPATERITYLVVDRFTSHARLTLPGGEYANHDGPIEALIAAMKSDMFDQSAVTLAPDRILYQDSRVAAVLRMIPGDESKEVVIEVEKFDA